MIWRRLRRPVPQPVSSISRDIFEETVAAVSSEVRATLREFGVIR